MLTPRRDILKIAGGGLAASLMIAPGFAADGSNASGARQNGGIFDVRQYGAVGDGTTIDSPAINKAIDAAASAGGGMVLFPAGIYASYSIHFKSQVTLFLGQGAVILAAPAPPEGSSGGYDNPEPPQPWEAYEDFGHNHWYNSLIWGVGLHDITICGPGRIWGRGLSRGNGPTARNPEQRRINGVGNKSIALKNCHNVVLKDFQILQGGWFGLLATGVDNMVIDNLVIDTNRDGLDIDCCQNVRVSNCTVNSPRDDAIVPKSSYALGYLRPTKNLTISNCYVTGTYEVGSVLDGTFKKIKAGTGRIKTGTESNGSFQNIAISNCVFEGCHGLALETVDGALLEDISITNITMRDITGVPIFLRLGARMRGPAGLPIGQLRRILISNIVASNVGSEACSILSGIPDHPIEDIKISDVYIQHQGGGTREQAAIQMPEDAKKYPEPTMFGGTPAQGFYLRHVQNIEMSHIEIASLEPDARPDFILDDVKDADFLRIKTQRQQGVPTFSLHDVDNFTCSLSRGIRETTLDHVSDKSL
ncbi:MAG: glycoside hydrolase family 28 protein [Acidobacteriaceae bacterium]